MFYIEVQKSACKLFFHALAISWRVLKATRPSWTHSTLWWPSQGSASPVILLFHSLCNFKWKNKTKQWTALLMLLEASLFPHSHSFPVAWRMLSALPHGCFCPPWLLLPASSFALCSPFALVPPSLACLSHSYLINARRFPPFFCELKYCWYKALSGKKKEATNLKRWKWYSNQH